MTREEQISRMDGADARSSAHFDRVLKVWPATDAEPVPKTTDAPVEVRIVSDGTTRGTKVYTESGERLRGVSRIAWNCAAGQDFPEAEITIGLAKVDMAGRAVMLAPDGRRIRKIEYEDGTVEVFGGPGLGTHTTMNASGEVQEVEV